MIVHPDGFRWPEQLTADQVAWLVAWAETMGDVFIADARILRDSDADGGLTLALVVDFPWPTTVLRDEGRMSEAVAPFSVMATMPAPSSTYPYRHVLALEMPRLVALVALVAEAQPKRPTLSLVPMETTP